jgi:hypothetical protein
MLHISFSKNLKRLGFGKILLVPAHVCVIVNTYTDRKETMQQLQWN